MRWGCRDREARTQLAIDSQTLSDLNGDICRPFSDENTRFYTDTTNVSGVLLSCLKLGEIIIRWGLCSFDAINIKLLIAIC